MAIAALYNDIKKRIVWLENTKTMYVWTNAALPARVFLFARNTINERSVMAELTIAKLDWELVGPEGDASFHYFNEACREDPHEVAQAIGGLLLDAEQGKEAQEYTTGVEYVLERVLMEGREGRRFAYGNDVKPGRKTNVEVMHQQTDRVYGALWDDERYARVRNAARGTELGSKESRVRGLTVLDMVLRHNAQRAGVALPDTPIAQVEMPTRNTDTLATAA
jgi:hypothetical protein